MGTTTQSPLFSLAGKTAIVTGSTRGIGFAIAEEFCRAGASCVISSENKDAVAATTQQLRDAGYSAMGQTCDVTDAQSLARLVDMTIDRFNGLDLLVCNAGIAGRAGPVDDLETADYAQVFDTNLHSMVRLAGLACPHLKLGGGGAVILMSSIAGLRGNAMIQAYALAKAGVAQLARNLAVQWGPDNVRANAISPGLIQTDFSDALMSDEAFMRRRMQMTPLRRLGEAKEVAGCALFLASPAGAFVTGQNLVVDGGTTITDGS